MGRQMNTKKSKGSQLAFVGLDPETDYEIGFYYGSIFDRLSYKVQCDVIEFTNTNKVFARAFGQGSGWKFANSSESTKRVLMKLCESNPELTVQFCYSLGNHLGLITIKIMSYLINLAKNNSFFASKLGYCIGFSFYSLKENMKKNIFDFADLQSEFAYHMGMGVKDTFNRLEDHDRKLVSDFAEKNERFANGMESKPK